MKKIYWISFFSGLSLNFVFLIFSFFGVTDYFSKIIEVFTDKNGSVIEFGLNKLIIFGLPYLIADIFIFALFAWLFRDALLRVVGKNMQLWFKIIGVNITGFYIGFALFGFIFLWILATAFSHMEIL